MLCYLQFRKAPKVKSDNLLNRGCKQKQIIKFRAPDLQGEEKEELKGALAFLLLYTALWPIPADPRGPALDTTCGSVPGRPRDCNLLQAEQGPSVFPLKNCTSFIQPLTKVTLPSMLALVPRENRHNLALNSCWFAEQVECLAVAVPVKMYPLPSATKPQSSTKDARHNLRLQLGTGTPLPQETCRTHTNHTSFGKTPNLLGRTHSARCRLHLVS